MEIKPGLAGEGLETVVEGAHELVGVLVAAFMMFEVLLQLESLPAPIEHALEDSIRKLQKRIKLFRVHEFGYEF